MRLGVTKNGTIFSFFFIFVKIDGSATRRDAKCMMKLNANMLAKYKWENERILAITQFEWKLCKFSQLEMRRQFFFFALGFKKKTRQWLASDLLFFVGVGMFIMRIADIKARIEPTESEKKNRADLMKVVNDGTSSFVKDLCHSQ